MKKRDSRVIFQQLENDRLKADFDNTVNHIKRSCSKTVSELGIKPRSPQSRFAALTTCCQMLF